MWIEDLDPWQRYRHVSDPLPNYVMGPSRINRVPTVNQNPYRVIRLLVNFRVSTKYLTGKQDVHRPFFISILLSRSKRGYIVIQLVMISKNLFT